MRSAVPSVYQDQIMIILYEGGYITSYLYVLSLLMIIPYQNLTFQLGSLQRVSYMNMRTNCCKNRSRSHSVTPTNPATLLPQLTNLLTKWHIKYGVTGSVRVSVRGQGQVQGYGQFLGLGFRVRVRFSVRVNFNNKQINK